MKTTAVEFEVDFIGDQSKLTIAEEKALSDYFKQKKANLIEVEKKAAIRKTKVKV